MSRISRMQLETLLGLLVVGAGVLWMITREIHFSGWVDDDAYISFRYARNLSEGHGLVFNPGERVEGYTNFLWTLLLTICHRLGLDFTTAARTLGAFFSILTLPVLWLFNRTSLLRTSGDAPVAPPVQIMAILVVCLSEAWAAWAVGGLENVLTGLLIVLSFWLYSVHLDGGRQKPLLFAAAVLSLAVLNHPTSLLFAGILALHLGWRALRNREQRAGWLWFVLVLSALLGGHLLWRLVYYGDPLPNTFYAKAGTSVGVLSRGLRYFAQVLSSFAAGYLAVVIVALLLVLRRIRSAPLALLMISILSYSLFVIAVGGEEFPAYRSIVVLVPLFALFLQSLAHRAVLRMGSAAGQASVMRQIAAWALMVTLVAASTLPLSANERVRRLDEAVRLDRTGLSIAAAGMLKQLLPEGTLFAHSGAGLIAFYTNFRWIDTLGLCDRHIARSTVINPGTGAAGHEKGDGAYVWSRQPDYIMFPGYPISDPRPGTKTGRELFAIPGFHQTYRPVRLTFRFQAASDDVPREHSLYLYERKGVPRPLQVP